MLKCLKVNSCRISVFHSGWLRQFQNKVTSKDSWDDLFYDFSFHLQWTGKRLKCEQLKLKHIRAYNSVTPKCDKKVSPWSIIAYHGFFMKAPRCLHIALEVLWKGKRTKQDTVTTEADCKKAIMGFSKLHTKVEEIEFWMCLVSFFRAPVVFFHLLQKCSLKFVPCCKILGSCQQRGLHCAMAIAFFRNRHCLRGVDCCIWLTWEIS